MSSDGAEDRRIGQVVIAGGGSAGWMTAAALARALGRTCRVRLIEPAEPVEDSGILTPFDSTLPALRAFNARLGLDEDAVVRATRATFRLGTEFADWTRPGRTYIHPLGEYGGTMEGTAFHHYWLKLRSEGARESLEVYSVAAAAARLGRFARPGDDPASVVSTMSYALHLDAAAYVRGLRAYAEDRGVERLEGETVGAERRESDGLLKALVLRDGRRVEGDLFVDCSGAAGLLIGGELQVPYEDWSGWLPCDRLAWTEVPGVLEHPSLTSAQARRAGWRWRVPLQGAAGWAEVYASRFTGDDEARLTAPKGAAPLRFARFTPGRRTRPWAGNCVAIGLSAACLEPLDSTGLHLVQSGVSKLLALFPDRSFAEGEAREYNRLMQAELERIRDLQILHYRANRRRGEPLWDHCRTMSLPEPLAHKIRMFESRGRVSLYDEETFLDPDWIAVFVGQEILPRRRHPFADHLPSSEVKARLARMRDLVRQAAEAMPSHADFLAGLGPAPQGRVLTRALGGAPVRAEAGR